MTLKPRETIKNDRTFHKSYLQLFRDESLCLHFLVTLETQYSDYITIQVQHFKMLHKMSSDQKTFRCYNALLQ